MAHNIKRPSFESQTDGRLIQRLLLKAGDLMHTDADVPTVSPFTLLPEIIAKIQTNELKMVCVVEDDGKLRGIISVKDLLVRIHQDQTNVIAQDIMQTDPVVLTVHTPLSEALTMMKHTRLEVLPVENEVGQLVGVISLHDILV